MKDVVDKCGRSTKLLDDLSSEKVRWEASSRGFELQIATLAGDVLVSGAFCTYIGLFDLGMRQQLNSTWKDELEEVGIKKKDDISVIDYLSKPSERLQWKENVLPDDD